jgi:hypothetical protein
VDLGPKSIDRQLSGRDGAAARRLPAMSGPRGVDSPSQQMC